MGRGEGETMRTFGEQSELIRAIMVWALEHPNLTGFGVRTDGDMLVVDMERGGRSARRAFSWAELDAFRKPIALVEEALYHLYREMA